MNMRDLKIMVVYPLYGGSLPIAQYCALALEDLGCQVQRFEANKLYCAYTGLRELELDSSRIDSLLNSFLKIVTQAIMMMVEEKKPDLVLALAQAPLDRTSLQKLRKMDIPTVMWFVEDYLLFNYWTILAPFYDAFAVIQKEPFLTELKNIGQQHAFYLPLAALPQFHQTLDLSDREKREYGAAISFLGAGYPNRRLAFRRLAERDFKIWGSDWENERFLERNIQRDGKRIDPEESVKIYNATKINLNLHSSVHTDQLISKGDFVNPRTFELAAMGAFQLVDKRSLMKELFAEDELATFESPEEFYQKIDYFLEHPEEREKYALKARQRTLENHTYQQRMRTLLEYMEVNFGPLKKENCQREEEESALPPEAKKLAGEVAEKLRLPSNASFDEVIDRLRSQSGQLDELETALLFLDEWRKQFKKKTG